MIDRICISPGSACNLDCAYCHFREKGIRSEPEMDVLEILRNVKAYARHPFRIGFVGSGEPLLAMDRLRTWLTFLEDSPHITCYTITNGTVFLPEEDFRFLEERGVNVGFSLDGPRKIQDRWRCGTWERVMENAERYRAVTGHWPTFNATVGRESLEKAEDVIRFFEPFGVRVTFSRMIGRHGISLEEYRTFLAQAERRLSVRRGALDCTMYGGNCGAGVNNFYFAGGQVYLCGNCADLPPLGPSGTPFPELERMTFSFDRTRCWRESVCG